jgi:hypothetical protein
LETGKGTCSGKHACQKLIPDRGEMVKQPTASNVLLIKKANLENQNIIAPHG